MLKFKNRPANDTAGLHLQSSLQRFIRAHLSRNDGQILSKSILATCFVGSVIWIFSASQLFDTGGTQIESFTKLYKEKSKRVKSGQLVGHHCSYFIYQGNATSRNGLLDQAANTLQ